MVSPKVQHFPTPAVRRVAHAPIVAKRLRESSLPPALRGPSGDSPLRRLRWASRALELRSRGFAAIRSFPPAFTPFRGHSITCGAARRADGFAPPNPRKPKAFRPRLGFHQGIPPCGACGGRIAHWSCAPGISRRYVPRLPCYFLSGSILPQSQLSASIL